MSKFILDSDPRARTRQTFQYDAGTDQYILQDVQDPSEILRANAHTRLHAGSSRTGHGDGLGRQVASIPLVIWMKLYKSGITRDRKAFARWLNDKDNSLFRTDASHI